MQIDSLADFAYHIPMKNLVFFTLVIAIVVLLFVVVQPQTAGDGQSFGQSTTISQIPLNSEDTATDWYDNSRDFLKFARFDMDGNVARDGAHYVTVFDPQSSQLDFQVIPGLTHQIREKLSDGQARQEYEPYNFSQLIRSQNAVLDGRQPFAAINADYINTQGQPQGLNISRGISYSGAFAQRRSSFAISGGTPESRVASIQVGSRIDQNTQFNTAGGNGRIYQNGQFQDICEAIGRFACQQSTGRSMAAVTSSGWVIWLVHNASESEWLFTPDMFDDTLESVAAYYDIGTIQEAILFDGGFSPAMLWNQDIVHSNFGPIGSVFALYIVEDTIQPE